MASPFIWKKKKKTRNLNVNFPIFRDYILLSTELKHSEHSPMFPYIYEDRNVKEKQRLFLWNTDSLIKYFVSEPVKHMELTNKYTLPWTANLPGQIQYIDKESCEKEMLCVG